MHKNKTCELCKASPINGIRYRSLVVTDREFNLCQTCFWSGAYRRQCYGRIFVCGATTALSIVFIHAVLIFFLSAGVETDQYKRHHAVIEFVKPETRGDRIRYMFRIKCVARRLN